MALCLIIAFFAVLMIAIACSLMLSGEYDVNNDNF